MTTQRIGDVLAEREGWIQTSDWRSGWMQITTDWPKGLPRTLPNYTESLDALQPVLEKLTEEEWDNLDDEIWCIAKSPLTYSEKFLLLKPNDLALCIVKAIGKFEPTTKEKEGE